MNFIGELIIMKFQIITNTPKFLGFIVLILKRACGQQEDKSTSRKAACF
jgi:hypothetical protein